MDKKLTIDDFRVLPVYKIYIRGEDKVVTTPKGHITLEEARRLAAKAASAEDFLNNPTIKGCFIETEPTYREATAAEVEEYEWLRAIRLNNVIEAAIQRHRERAQAFPRGEDVSDERCIKGLATQVAEK